MTIIKKFNSFVNEMYGVEVGVELEYPKAKLQDKESTQASEVINRFENIYKDLSDKEKKEINSYFEK